MPHDFGVWRTIVPRLKRDQYAGWMKTIHNSLSFDTSDVAKYRCHVLDHYYAFGWKSAVNAFGVRRSTLYDWKKAYEASGKRLDSLIPRTTRPHHTRTSIIDWRLIEFIKEFREQHGNIDRRKIKIFLDEYALGLKLAPLAADTIGKLIRRRGFTSRPRKRRRSTTGLRLNRLKRTPKVTAPGYIQMDSVAVYVLGKRFTFISVIDIYTKYAYASRVGSSRANNSMVVLAAFQATYPFTIHTIQTDNGHEFLGEFHRYCLNEGILHEFIYPRSPKINGVVERFNRTLQEEFLHRHDELSYDKPYFQRKLNQYLEWYNTRRPHMSLAYRSPIQFMQGVIPKTT